MKAEPTASLLLTPYSKFILDDLSVTNTHYPSPVSLILFPTHTQEYDMLDLAYGLTDTSRLGCQIFLTKDLDNLVVDIPPGIADARS